MNMGIRNEETLRLAREWIRLDRISDIEAKCRSAFDNEFHKIKASMTYDQWRLAFKTGWRESAAHPKTLRPATVQMVDEWFRLNTGLGGCSDANVAELAAIFYGTNQQQSPSTPNPRGLR